MDDGTLRRIYEEKSRNLRECRLSFGEFKNLHRFLSRIAEKKGVSSELVDFSSVVDLSLSYRENKEKIRKLVGSMRSITKEQFDRLVEEHEREHERELLEEDLDRIKKGEIPDLRPFFRRYTAHVETFLDNSVVRGMVVVGKRGIGKSYNLLLMLRERNANFVVIRGHQTPLSFYKTLYEHSNGYVLVLDDTVNVLENRDIQSLLLGALDYDNNVVQWNSTSPLMEDLPSSFRFNSKVILLLNEMPKNNEVMEAILDRCVVYRLEFSKKELLEMLCILARQRGYPEEVFEFIRENADFLDLSLRLLDKIHAYYGREGWEDLAREVSERDSMETYVLRLCREEPSTREQVKRFIEETGYSRRTFFRIKAKLRGEGLL
jgi:hypothetical protein